MRTKKKIKELEEKIKVLDFAVNGSKEKTFFGMFPCRGLSQRLDDVNADVAGLKGELGLLLGRLGLEIRHLEAKAYIAKKEKK